MGKEAPRRPPKGGHHGGEQARGRGRGDRAAARAAPGSASSRPLSATLGRGNKTRPQTKQDGFVLRSLAHTSPPRRGGALPGLPLRDPCWGAVAGSPRKGKQNKTASLRLHTHPRLAAAGRRRHAAPASACRRRLALQEALRWQERGAATLLRRFTPFPTQAQLYIIIVIAAAATTTTANW